MRALVFLIAMLAAASFSSAFCPVGGGHHRTTTLEMTAHNYDHIQRRQVIALVTAYGALSILTMKPKVANPFSQQLDDYAYEPSQQATDGKLDLNSAFVGDYKTLRGMFPSSAGKIASNGPYEKVKDIYKIPGLTDHDIAMFKTYEKSFTVKPPGRAFDERINARVST